ncbi:MAG: N-acetyl-gamma-glutamyl-phosphate reductase [Actinomycetales bacterium]
MRVGVIGASGYAGGELLRLLETHPVFELTTIAAGGNAGEDIATVHPHLISLRGRKFQETTSEIFQNIDLVFLALPHGESAKLLSQIPSDVKVVDLGADFRLTDSAKWEKYYGGNYAGKWSYGLPELPGAREEIKRVSRIANPGCYATAITLAIAPLANLIDTSDIVAVAASGTTGAGRSNKVSLSASEVANSLISYKFGGVHQHTPEIEEAISTQVKREVRVSFTPILAPMPRGILATVTAKTDVSYHEVRETYAEFAARERFVELLPEGVLPKTGSVIGSNFIQVQVALDQHTSRVVVSTAIDNLGKGASSQAIQNANLISGLAEDDGISSIGIGQ